MSGCCVRGAKTSPLTRSAGWRRGAREVIYPAPIAPLRRVRRGAKLTECVVPDRTSTKLRRAGGPFRLRGRIDSPIPWMDLGLFSSLVSFPTPLCDQRWCSSIPCRAPLAKSTAARRRVPPDRSEEQEAPPACDRRRRACRAARSRGCARCLRPCADAPRSRRFPSRGRAARALGARAR